MNQQQIKNKTMDIIILLMYLGAIVYIIGAIVYIYVLRNKKVDSKRIFLYSIIRTILSIVISCFIWQFWMFDIDIMCFFILLPAVMSEIITLSCSVILLKGLKCN